MFLGSEDWDLDIFGRHRKQLILLVGRRITFEWILRGSTRVLCKRALAQKRKRIHTKNVLAQGLETRKHG